MAWNDETLDSMRGPVRRAIDVDAVVAPLREGAARGNAIRDTAAEQISLRRAAITQNPDFEPAEFAMNSETGEIALPNGQIVKANAPTILQLATLKSRDGTPLPKMNAVPGGFRPVSQAEMQRIVDSIPTESDFWGEAYAAGKTTLGLMASTIDAMFGNDDPGNEWSNAQRNLENDQTIGQVKAGRGRWYSSFDSFLSGLGETAGNVGGTVIGALPVAGAAAGAGAVTGAGVGAIPGGALGAGLAVSGGTAAFGEQATDFYDAAMDAMSKMDPAQLEEQSPMYREVVSSSPDITHEEAMREVAIRGARMAGAGASLLGAAEGIVGGKLAGNFLARLGVSRALLGPAMQAVEKRTGVGATALRVGGRTALGGALAGAEEVGESVLGQSLGATATGIGSQDPTSYVSGDEFWAGALGGGIFGALGGRGSVAAAENSDLAQALSVDGTPDVNTQQATARQQGDLVPDALRATAVNQQRAAAMTPPQPTPDEISQRLQAVLAERYGPNWFDMQDRIAQEPQGRQLLGQLIGIERERRAAGDMPAYERQGQPAPYDNAVPLGQGNAPLPPVQEPQAPPAPVASVPQETPPAPNLRERRTFQQMRQDERLRASEQAPAALPQSESSSLEQQIFALEDEVNALEEQLAMRPPRDPRKKYLRESLKRANARLKEAEAAWEAAVNQENAPTAVNAPEPANAPQERTPDGRPVGVAPPPLPNPEPMSAGEAASRAQTQQNRRSAAGAPAAAAATPEQVAAAAAQSEQSVSPSTPEPPQDVEAQVLALTDPESGRDAVFLAPGSRPPANLPEGVTRVVRAGIGTLLTTNPAKAREFRTKQLTDRKIQQILGYSESKADAIRSGEEPVVVQARTPSGAVAAEQITSRRGVPKAKKAVAKLGPKGAKVVETSVQKAQARREQETKPKRPLKKAKATDEETPGRKDNDTETRADRALAQSRATREATTPAEAAADVVERATTRRPDRVLRQGKKVELPTRMTRLTGTKGRVVDLRTEALDEDARYTLGHLLDGGLLNATDRAKVEQAIREFDQMEKLLDAATEAAEDRTIALVREAPDGGEDYLRESARKQLELEHTMQEGNRGRPRERPKTSPIAYLPLVVEESRGFLKALRDQAKVEVAEGYAPAHSPARQMLSAIRPEWHTALQSELEGKRLLRAFAQLTDDQLESVLQRTHMQIADSTVAKQVMRGATEVAHAIRRMEQDLSTQRMLQDFADHRIDGVDANVQPYATEHGDVPAAAKGLVNSWVRQFEKGGNKFSAPVHVMSVQNAMKLHPGAFLDGRVPNGKFLRLTDAKGNPSAYILAVDWPRFKFEGTAIEVLAHEFGHMATTELYARTDPRTRRAIDAEYDRWLQAQAGRSVDDILRDQMPNIERITFAGGATNRAYATNFWEWAARNAALYVLDPNRPFASRVEKFFKQIADVMRALLQKLTGSNEPNAVWAESLDRWVNGTMAVQRMPQVPAQFYDHDEFADAKEPAQRAITNQVARTATAVIEPLRKVMSGTATRQDIEAVTRPVVESKVGEKSLDVGLALMTLRQIERKYRDTPLGPALSAWTRLQQTKAKTANTTMEEGSQWMERANQLDAKVRETLEQVMYYATHFKVHPDQPLTADANQHLRRGSDYVQEVNEKRYRQVVDLYNAMTKADPSTAKIYAGLRDAFTKLHGKTLAKLLENVDQADFSDGAKKQMKERITAAQQELRDGPYFPLMRFGNWIVRVSMPAFAVGKGGKQDGAWFDTKTEAREEMRHQRALNPGARVTVERTDEGQYLVRVYQRGVYFFESQAAAKAARADIEREVREHYAANDVDFESAQQALQSKTDEEDSGEAIISEPFGAIEGFEQRKQASAEFMHEARNLLNQGKLDPEVAATLERLAIEALPENSYRHSMLPRQNIFGASKQMLRAYAHRYQGAAHHYSVVEHGAAINKNWSRIAETREKYPDAAQVYNNLKANQQAIADRMAPTTANTIMNTITDASSLYSLGFSPAYVLTNALQPWTVAAPVLAGLVNKSNRSIGLVKASKYLREAYEGAVPFFTKRGMGDFANELRGIMGQKGTNATLQDTALDILRLFGKTDGEQKMLQSLLERGTLDFSWLNSLEDAMRGGKVGQKWAALQRLGMAFPQQVEAMNRVTTALAAYRLAKDEGLTDGSETSLQEFADDMVADTQLDYSRMNRPLAFNKAGLNIILQFKLYMQGMYMLFIRHASMAMRGKTPEERKQGRRTIAYLLTTHAAAAGGAGLGPIAGTAKLALVLMAMASPEDDDDWKSGEQLMREFFTESFGEYGGVVAERGLPAALGVDMSDRIGLPNLIDSRFAQIKETDSAATGMDKWVLYSLGAPYSNLRRVVQGTYDAANGDFSSAVNGLPAAARAMARSAKWAREGIVDKDGDTFIPRSELGWGDLTIQTLGLTPLATSEAYRGRTEVKQTMARILMERKAIMQAARTGEDVTERVKEFNASVPGKLRITGQQLTRSAEAKEKREAGEVSRQEAEVRRMLGQ